MEHLFLWVSVLNKKVILTNYLSQIYLFLFSLFPTFVSEMLVLSSTFSCCHLKPVHIFCNPKHPHTFLQPSMEDLDGFFCLFGVYPCHSKPYHPSCAVFQSRSFAIVWNTHLIIFCFRSQDSFSERIFWR